MISIGGVEHEVMEELHLPLSYHGRVWIKVMLASIHKV